MSNRRRTRMSRAQLARLGADWARAEAIEELARTPAQAPAGPPPLVISPELAGALQGLGIGVDDRFVISPPLPGDMP